MRNFFALVGMVVVGFAVIGWYCGWYTFNLIDSENGKPEIKATFDTKKVAEDSSSFFRNVTKIVQEKSNQAAGEGGKSTLPVSAPGNTPAPSVSAPTNSTSNGGAIRSGWLLGPTRTGQKQ